ncbi:HD domain-containing protein [Actinoplanes sp. NPDC000266]
MSEVIAGLAVPETAAVAEATELIRRTATPLIYHHSRRIFFFGLIHAGRLGLAPDPELLYLSALFHDAGLLSGGDQRFELDSADTARSFLLERGFPAPAAETVWTAIALLDAHPRGDFKNGFLQAYLEGIRHRPETTNGTVNADVLEHFVPGFRRTTTVERVLNSPWPS